MGGGCVGDRLDPRCSLCAFSAPGLCRVVAVALTAVMKGSDASVLCVCRVCRVVRFGAFPSPHTLTARFCVPSGPFFAPLLLCPFTRVCVCVCVWVCVSVCFCRRCWLFPAAWVVHLARALYIRRCRKTRLPRCAPCVRREAGLFVLLRCAAVGDDRHCFFFSPLR